MNNIKREQRHVYRELTELVGYQLCMFCKYEYPDCYGESPCDSGEPSCHHPLNEHFEFNYGSYGIEPGCDCWGFRSCMDISSAADIIGMILVNKWNGGVTWWTDKKGQMKINGSTFAESYQG